MRSITTLTLLVCGFVFTMASAAEGRPPQRPSSEELQAKREAFKERLAQHREQHGEGQGGTGQHGEHGPCRERMEAMRKRMEEIRERVAAFREQHGDGAGPQRPGASGERLRGPRGPRGDGSQDQSINVN